MATEKKIGRPTDYLPDVAEDICNPVIWLIYCYLFYPGDTKHYALVVTLAVMYGLHRSRAIL